MAGRLQGKVALVTGAGSSGPGVGIGKATSVLLAREGASVLLVDMHPERAEVTLRMIVEEGGTASVFAADISRQEDSEAMIAAAVDRFGGLDILINNAARSHHGPIQDIALADYESVVGVNLTGAFLACKFALPHLVARGGGSIVNVASIAGLRDSGVSGPAYSATKAGLLGLTVDLAGAQGLDNVRVNAVVPGMILGPMADTLREGDSKAPSLEGMNLLGRMGNAWDVAKAIVFLCSDEAAYITGIALPVDGGASVATPASYKVRAARFD